MIESELKECVAHNGRHYLVSEDGLTVVSGATQRTMKQSLNADGYYNCGGITVHNLVAPAWIGPSPDKEAIVDHIDRDRTHNDAGNLRWTTRRVNRMNS